MFFFDNTKPIIVLGMHRSGTSLISEVLSTVGIQMGHDLNSHNESQSLLEINESILTIAHTFWDYPKNIEALYKDCESLNNITQDTRKKIGTPRFRKRYLKKDRHKIHDSNFLWGWKEPRTTITFPIWYNIFPEAKFIFIVRNGVDVAYSLYKRELGRRGHIHNPYHSLRCLELKRAYELWEEYNEFFIQHRSIIPPKNLLSFTYEKFLSQPSEIIAEIESFLQIDFNSKENLIRKIDVSKRYQFLTDNQLLEFYESIKNRILMKKFGFNNIVSDLSSSQTNML